MTIRRKDIATIKHLFHDDGLADVPRSYHEASGLLESKEDAQNKSTQYTYLEGGKLHTRTWARTQVKAGNRGRSQIKSNFALTLFIEKFKSGQFTISNWRAWYNKSDNILY